MYAASPYSLVVFLYEVERFNDPTVPRVQAVDVARVNLRGSHCAKSVPRLCQAVRAARAGRDGLTLDSFLPNSVHDPRRASPRAPRLRAPRISPCPSPSNSLCIDHSSSSAWCSRTNRRWPRRDIWTRPRRARSAAKDSLVVLGCPCEMAFLLFRIQRSARRVFLFGNLVKRFFSASGVAGASSAAWERLIDREPSIFLLLLFIIFPDYYLVFPERRGALGAYNSGRSWLNSNPTPLLVNHAVPPASLPINLDYAISSMISIA